MRQLTAPDTLQSANSSRLYGGTDGKSHLHTTQKEENEMATITPQALGSLIKRTGIKKSADKKGNFYNYHTEGYSLVRQHGQRYTVNYYSRLQMARPSEQERESFQARRDAAFCLIFQALSAKGISHEFRDGTLWIDLAQEMAVA